MNEADQAAPLAMALHTHGVELTPIRGGYHVKDLPGGQCVDVMRMLFNWRIVRSDAGHVIVDRGWCYEGTGPTTFLRAVGQATAWDGGDRTEPEGWLKRALPVPGVDT